MFELVLTKLPMTKQIGTRDKAEGSFCAFLYINSNSQSINMYTQLMALL